MPPACPRSSARFEAGNSRNGSWPRSTTSSRGDGAVADARLRPWPLRSSSPQRREEVEAPGLGSEVARGSVTAACPVPARGGQRLITPRCVDSITVSVKLLSEVYSAKKRSSTAPSRKTPVPSNAFSSKRDRDLDAARRVEAVLLAQPPHDRPAGDALDAADALLGDGVGKVGEQRQHLAQGRRRGPSRRGRSGRDG